MEHKLLVSPARPAAPREYKSLAGGAALTSAAGEFEGYASLFGVADLGDDMVMPGAFAASLRRRGAAGIKLLWQHDAAQPIGVWLAMVEDAKGLHVRGRLNLDVARAREVYSLMREGSVDGLSIGFRTEKATRDRKKGLRRLERIDLWEVSVVTFPMLPQARVSAVKRGKNQSDGISPLVDVRAHAVSRALLSAAHSLR